MTPNDPPRIPALQVRPTLRALKLLPPDGQAITAARSVLERARQEPDKASRIAVLTGLRLGELEHPLLDDVRTIVDQGGMPDPHRSSTRAAGRTVYEGRSRTGAAWRGGFVLESDIMWLVFADRHDRFHSTAADYFKKGDWLPGPLDEHLAAQDAARIRLRRWNIDALTAILDALRTTATEKRPTDVELTSPTGDDTCTLRLEIEHEDPAPTADLAHTTSSMLDVKVLIRSGDHELLRSVLEVLAAIRDGAGKQDQTYMPGGGLMLLSTMSHARLAQLTATVNDTTDAAVLVPAQPAPTALHYVNRGRLAEGFVDGTAVLSLCGQWFVPTLDGTADLPVCTSCEEHQPVAQALLDNLRS